MEAGAHELTAAYALDALDPDERRAYEDHLVGCERCQAELAALWGTTEALAVGASGAEPRPELRERILAAAHAEPQVVVPLEPQRRRAVPVLAAAAALAAAIALAVGLWGAGVSSNLDEARSALERERATASILADPGARTVALQAGDGRLVVAPDGRVVVVLAGLDPAPEGRTYQLWIVPGGDIAAATSGGLFTGGDAIDVALVNGTVSDGDLVAVTVEREGGVNAPSSDPVVASAPI
ncbi:MAG TPA: anti-sigma factor [Gaiellaceae bacterium]|nr:anti-sigma factor [Gaiellaceae bacterium]